ncbi:MAG: hypothetical protein M3N56_12845 [Actinomycetota bacterium]|nr:hypothetical protein [Actinomycetota bacterium]
MRRVVYWAAVVVVSLVLVVGLILFLESRDQSSVGDSRGTSMTATGHSGPGATFRA